MKRFFILFAFFLLAQPLLATSIIVFVSKDYIIIGADSKRKIIDKENNTAVSQSVCKIQKVENYCFAMAGLVASQSTSFAADSIVKYHLRRHQKLEKSVTAIQKALVKALEKELQYQNENLPLTFRTSVASSEHLLEVVILSTHKGVPQVQVLGFSFTNTQGIAVKAYTSDRTGNGQPKGTQLYFLGEYDAVEKYLQNTSHAVDPVLLVENLITAQSQSTPSSVSAPVSIARFSAQGIEWIK